MLLDAFAGAGRERIVAPRPAPYGRHETGVFEQLEVMRDGRLVEVKPGREIADADLVLGPGQRGDDGRPGRSPSALKRPASVVTSRS